MNKSEQINELAAALSIAQGQMEPAKMNAVNPFLKNRYSDLSSVIQAARKPLSDNGLSFTQHPSIDNERVSVSTILMHASGQWVESSITLPLDGGKGLSLAQSMGAIITYLRRYSISAILGISADEDTDGNDAKTTDRKQQSAIQPQRPERPTNGNGKEHQPTALERLPVPTFVMSREEAEAEPASDGTPYGQLESAELENRIHGIAKGLKKEGLTIEQKDTYKRKSRAIAVILEARQAEDESAAVEINQGE